MTEFTPLASTIGGALIGLSAVLLMALHGRIAGMTGILSGLLPPVSPDWAWRGAFLAGAVVAPSLVIAMTGFSVGYSSPVPLPWIVAGGLVVGAGAHFGSGCTSGHGVCGMARLSPRSIAATVTFLSVAMLTVYVIRHMLGGV